ncbi:GTPase [Candidatus Micrarchaeota archaeon]|nr:GTPase [Candidatus Micrarchaeota archaeon]
MRKNVIIMGAAGRDFHNFNILFRNKKEYNVVCFTAEQIPGISGRKYPKGLAGKLYPGGIPIYPETKLPELIKKYKACEVYLSYSDISNQNVMEKAGIVNSAGADFILSSPENTMLKSKRKIISVCAVRTGCGKSPVSRKIAGILKKHGKRFVVIRHPMPYGDLKKQEVQRFETLEDLDIHNCTIEEREDYEPHIRMGSVVYAGVDYKKILKKAEKEAEIILWDGGNNDTPFFKPNLHIVLADALRAGHELEYYPGFANFLMADVILINKENNASKKDVKKIMENAERFNPGAVVMHSGSVLKADGKIPKGKCIVVEDGPTVTHGGMKYGAGYIFAYKHGIKIIDAGKYAEGTIKETYEKYPHLKKILPAVGYSKKQINGLRKTIIKSKADFVVSGTPADIKSLLKLETPVLRVEYSIKEKGITLERVLKMKKII